MISAAARQIWVKSGQVVCWRTGSAGSTLSGAVGQEREGFFLLRDDYGLERSFELGALALFHAGGEPVDAAERVEQAAQGRGGLFDILKQRGRCLDFCNVRVGHLFDLSHVPG